MGTFKVNGDISATGAISARNCWVTGSESEEIQLGTSNSGRLLYLYNQGITGNRGIYDNQLGSIFVANEYGVTFYGALSGNASTASKLATARTISLTGSVTGSGSFDGSGNLSISTTTNHTHSYLPLSGGTLTGLTSISYAHTGGGMLQLKSTSNNEASLSFESGGTQYWVVGKGCGGTGNGTFAWWYGPSGKNIMTLTSTGNLNIGGKVDIWTDSEGGNIRITSPNGSIWSIDALNNSELRFIWAEASIPVKFSSGGGIFGNSIQLSSHTWSSAPSMYNAEINFGVTIDALTSSTHYKPWIGGSHGVSGHGYYATITAGLYHTNDPSRGGFYIGASWDMNASDTFYYFSRDGHFITPRLVTNNYGSSFPGTPYNGEVFFKI